MRRDRQAGPRLLTDPLEVCAPAPFQTMRGRSYLKGVLDDRLLLIVRSEFTQHSAVSCSHGEQFARCRGGRAQQLRLKYGHDWRPWRRNGRGWHLELAKQRPDLAAGAAAGGRVRPHGDRQELPSWHCSNGWRLEESVGRMRTFGSVVPLDPELLGDG